MSAELIDGKAIGEALDLEAKAAGEELAKKLGRPPCLAVVLIGEDPASQVYVRNKVRRTEAAGLRSVEVRKPADITQDEAIEIVRGLNADPEVDGILVQLPLPDHMDANAVIETIDPDKDVDGLTEASAGRLVLGKPGLRPCTPAGCVYLAEQALGDLSGKSVVVVGRSILVGKPAALLFLEKNATVTIAHSRTKDLPALCRTADILVPAVGRPEMVRGDWVKSGACVLDVGINRIDAPERGEGKTRLVGDAAFDEIVGHAGWITPVPGGIGPMTIAMLLQNTLRAAALRLGV
ncbi:MAG: bifunctional methylenetetrahydrofolate dehydrogenase/methenyltetrahydrofolate cyclohydrolase FolD [Maricaulis sp.]|uniref:bifunctional methylenetetrahydrofolate dehydrogenase/methenyltetrahydrofolate cyclohydrolase FolD n=1 Tax=Maricaulis sp. TaxID=1486257 RepID=UPI001B1758A6|nr:bifunctional methylenetetrahydrofolate dehydrogenase/methenyltetrahydrofolate cyclohydrolase FolD [Maricaulis sp.]MBO6728925.1 bifunctional methylenetetrahydrofolate dehydrogenase/methenyltetrahydrofolate cyclohydrolase FolD [Maricaulis sp.]MBO6847580.1 bifunctional methylenetetrahydrofolate dehydrogenase/methenyltetrahydrofolate cyclohydrolase FolD [Maricaulis sp.]MBO6876993.1 bifunctional methylenetetrahydrofolate dehydrogenase/methenyltetrahydrofolate cyclohydrolase FolD [Maricaulis sp.]